MVLAAGCGSSKQAEIATRSTSETGSKKVKHIAVDDIRSCMTSHGYTFKRWKVHTALGWFPQDQKFPTHGVDEANSADGSVSVEYAFGKDPKEATDIARRVNDLGAMLDEAGDEAADEQDAAGAREPRLDIVLVEEGACLGVKLRLAGD